MDEELYHYGVKGMKWGVRRTPSQLGHTTGTKKKKSGSSVLSKAKTAISNRREASKQKKAEASARKSQKKKRLSEMSDDELQAQIKRLELEKRYRDLTPKQTHRGRDFVTGILENSARNIATQATTYAMGSAVNAVLKDITGDPQVVNPKKGQKDK